MLEWLMISGVVISILLIVMYVVKGKFGILSKVCLCIACSIVIAFCIANMFEHIILSIVIMIIVLVMAYCFLFKDSSLDLYKSYDYDYYTMSNNDNINELYDEYENDAAEKHNLIENIYLEEVRRNDFKKIN